MSIGYHNPKLDSRSPINWEDPLNAGLLADFTVAPLSGWHGGVLLRDLVRGAHNPHDGTISGGVTWKGNSRPGSYGALSFDGSSGFVDFGTSQTLGPPAITVACWVNSSAFTNSYNTVVSRYTSTGPNFYQLFVKSNGKIALYLAASGFDIHYDGTGNFTLSTGVWYHLSFTYNSVTGLVGYVNAQVDGTAAQSGAFPAISATLTIGKDTNTAGRWWTGAIDGLQIYNRTLSAAEITALYNETKYANPNRWNWGSKKSFSVSLASHALAGSLVPSHPKLDSRSPINWDHPINAGLVAEWAVTPLSGWRGGLMLRDLVRGVKNPHDGTRVNNPLWIGSNRPGGYGALTFNGSTNYVSCGEASLFVNLTGSITMACWVKPAITGRADFFTHWGEAGDRHWILLHGVTDGKFRCYFNLNSGVQNTGDSTTSIVTGTWYHVAASFDGRFSRLYINGKQESSFDLGGPDTIIADTGSDVRLGSSTESSPHAFPGSIDGAVIYNRAISPSEVSALYQESKAGNPGRWNWRRKAFSISVTSIVTDWAKIWRIGPNAPLNSGNPIWKVAI